MIARIKQFASFHFLPAFEPTGRSLNLPIKSIKLVPYTVSFVLSSQRRTDNKFPIDKVDDRMLNRIYTLFEKKLSKGPLRFFSNFDGRNEEMEKGNVAHRDITYILFPDYSYS